MPVAMLIFFSAFFMTAAPHAAWAAPDAPHPSAGEIKIGVLLVNHGSRSATWRNALLQLESAVTPSVMAAPSVKSVKTAFMEYTEPSIATRMKEFDADGFTDVIIVPVFLTVSPHTFDDIPTILGMKEDPHSLQQLKIENILRYTPRARPHLTPPLDFTDILQRNLLKRVSALSKDPAHEGIVLIGYGDETYDKEWVDLFNRVAGFIRERTGIAGYSYGWCGHIANYKPEETTAAINTVLKTSNTALVIPVLVAHDEMFQIKIIGDGIAKVPDNKTRVRYKPDAILPDANLEQWVVSVTDQYARRIQPKVSRAN